MQDGAIQEAWLRAWRFAAEAHRGQTVPGTDLPYLVHLGAVAMEVLVAHQILPFERPALAVQCALLHDTLEDTEASESELLARFGPEINAGVRALTKDLSLEKSAAMADSLRRVARQPREIGAVKLADRITNLAPPPSHWSTERMAAYREEAREILAALGTSHPALADRLAQKIAAYPSGS